MSDLFENVAAKFKNSPSALVLFLASFVMLVIGVNHFAEDVYSSYKGLLSIERHFNMNVQIFNWTYWTMSVSAQIASIVYFYIYLANTDKRWALTISVLCQAIDFLSDLWYRSNGAMFTDWGATIVGALITLAFFTLASEVFITIGAGLCLKLAAPAIRSWEIYKKSVKSAKSISEGSFEEKQEKNTENSRNRDGFGRIMETPFEQNRSPKTGIPTVRHKKIRNFKDFR